jgi:hypothetical protein
MCGRRKASGQRVDLLKLDIEGLEERLFSSGYSSWIGCMENITIEPHGQRAVSDI